MWALDLTDTNCRDGKWYTIHLQGLDTGAHAYRFTARRGTDWAYFPNPSGTYATGPTISP
jgi:hypothetical protein